MILRKLVFLTTRCIYTCTDTANHKPSFSAVLLKGERRMRLGLVKFRKERVLQKTRNLYFEPLRMRKRLCVIEVVALQNILIPINNKFCYKVIFHYLGAKSYSFSLAQIYFYMTLSEPINDMRSFLTQVRNVNEFELTSLNSE